MRTALTIAGSDSGGGAGIQADLKTFAVHGVYGTSAITAVTAQNTLGVRDVLSLPPALVLAQMDAVLSDIGADAIKLGMLGTPEIAAAVADRLDAYPGIPIVLDPVMVAKGGARLIDDDGVAVMRARLVPRAAVVTANVPEASVLTGLPLRTVDDLEAAARAIVALGARAALVKGGHLDGPAVDVLVDEHGTRRFEAARIATVHTHGTGCTLAAALTARMALGDSLIDATVRAKRYVTWAIAHAPGLGHGHGPLAWGPGGLDEPDRVGIAGTGASGGTLE
jgi:hydroxymethylpyrimidine/phosphomethylpyrimidine kinase